jgi:hypothetical protein
MFGDELKLKGWDWIPQDDMGGASASTITKVARNLSLSPTEQLAREVIQNSWDAAQKLRNEAGHEFLTRFRFVDLSKAQADEIREYFALNDLRGPFEEELGLTDSKAGLVLGKGPASLLIVEDFGAHGLYGHPRLKKKSIMFRALYTVGSTGKDTSDELSGGSFGFGKSAFISASASNTVVAYSCFRPFDDDKVTRRLVGWTWHDEFEKDSEYYEGRAIFGEFFQEDSGAKVKPQPYEDSKADQLASYLTISEREAEKINDLGTSLVLFDPVIDPELLCQAIEDNWWPAIVDPSIRLNIEVVRADGVVLHPKPKSRKDLLPLIKAYEIATQVNDAPLGTHEKKVVIPPIEGFENIGAIGLVAEYSEEENAPRSAPKALLTRGPRMLIGELEHRFQNKSVSISAVFATELSNGPVDNALRKTEPYTHDRWSTSTSDEDLKAAVGLSKHIQSRLISEVNTFAKAMVNEAPISPRRLLGFSKIFGKFFGDSAGPSPIVRNALPVSIKLLSRSLKAVEGKNICLSQSFEISRSDETELSAEEKSKQYLLTPSLNVVVDDGSKGDSIALSVSLPAAKAAEKNEDGSLLVSLEPGEKLRIQVESEPYDHRWSASIRLEVEEAGSK